MKKFKFNKVSVIILAVAFTLGLGGIIAVRAIVLPFTPDLGVATTFGVLSSTFSNSDAGNTITGDLGYTTGPATAPTLIGVLHTDTTDSPVGSVYTDAGAAQAAALSDLNSQDCTYTFPSGDIVLSTDMTHVTAGYGSVQGEYIPGVYCTAGAASTMSIGTGGISLNGSGTYLFRSDGALNTVTGSSVATTGGASACDVFWTPNGATTLNSSSTFKGTVIPILAAAHDITVYEGVTWVGRALTFGHTVTFPQPDVIITVPTCTLPHLTVTKEVIGGGPKANTTFPLFIDAGLVLTGVATQVFVGAHVVTETPDSNYTRTFSASCPGGNISLTSGVPSEVDKTCTITNTYHTPLLTLDKIVVGGSSAESAWTLTATGPTIISGLGATGSTDVVSGTGPVPAAWIGTYTLSESGTPANYTASAWSCMTNTGAPVTVTNASVEIAPNANVICTITNTYHAPSSGGGGGYIRPVFSPFINILSTPVVIAPAPIIPKLPKTGYPPEEKSAMLPIVLLSGLSLVSIFLYFAQKKQTT